MISVPPEPVDRSLENSLSADAATVAMHLAPQLAS